MVALLWPSVPFARPGSTTTRVCPLYGAPNRTSSRPESVADDPGGRESLEDPDPRRPPLTFRRGRVLRGELVTVGNDVATWSGGFYDLRPAPDGGWNDPAVEKLCSSCGRSLPLDRFHRNPRLRTGLCSWCKDCGVERTRRWRAEHPEAEQRYNAERRAAYREVHPPTEKQCVVCGASFVGRPDRIVCSVRCRQTRQLERRRERRSLA
jgi:predicted nucleic acid-binding Zn ribbon protein